MLLRLHFRLRMFLALIIFSVFQGCGFGPSKDGSIHIRFNFQSLPPSLQSLFYILRDGAAGGLPQTVSDFSCLVINVMGEGIDPQKRERRPSDFLSRNTKSEYCSYSGVTSVPISNQQESVSVDLTVPSGKNRTIQILGVYDPGNVYCSSKGEIGKSTELSEAEFTFFEVGRIQRDLFFNQTIEIQNTYNALATEVERTNRDVSCPQSTSSGSSDPAPIVTAISPTEGIYTSNNNIPVTVTGDNFKSGAIICFESSSYCCEASFVSSTELKCNAPNHAAGIVDVIVKNPDGNTGTFFNLFTYIDNTNLFFWYKADTALNTAGTPIAENDPVSSWPDSSGNGFTLGKFGSDLTSNLPTYKSSVAVGTNSKPVVLFGVPGISTVKRLTYDTSADATAPSAYTLFLVTKQTGNPTAVSVVLGLNQTYSKNTIFIGGASDTTLCFGKNDAYSHWLGVWPTTKFFRWTVLVTAASNNGGIKLYNQDNVADLAITNEEIANRGELWNRITLGANTVGGEYFSGYIAEVMGYKAALTDSNRILVQNYLANKYGFDH